RSETARRWRARRRRANYSRSARRRPAGRDDRTRFAGVIRAVKINLNYVSFDPRNILVIDFGQLGDVVLSLPALRAIRERFPRARITVAAGKPGAEVVDLCGYADRTLVVDRVALRDGLKVVSIMNIARLV